VFENANGKMLQLNIVELVQFLQDESRFAKPPVAEMWQKRPIAKFTRKQQRRLERMNAMCTCGKVLWSVDDKCCTLEL
jgi:hypothetical protein